MTKTILGSMAVIIGLISVLPYIRDILKGRTKPHAFSWLIWGTLTAIGFFGQLTDNPGSGAWVTGFTSATCFSIFILAMKKGEKNIIFADWISLFGALIALLLWSITKNPLMSVILIAIIDAVGFIPTVRKSYLKPYEETPSLFALAGLKFVFALLALEKFSIITAFYPFSLVITNWTFLVVLLLRRRKLQKV